MLYNWLKSHSAAFSGNLGDDKQKVSIKYKMVLDAPRRREIKVHGVVLLHHETCVADYRWEIIQINFP